MIHCYYYYFLFFATFVLCGCDLIKLAYPYQLTVETDKVYQLHSHGRWFSPGTPASSTTKTDRHDIDEILLKVALSTINQIKQICLPLLFKMHIQNQSMF